jgi:hypothetical protein
VSGVYIYVNVDLYIVLIFDLYTFTLPKNEAAYNPLLNVYELVIVNGNDPLIIYYTIQFTGYPNATHHLVEEHPKFLFVNDWVDD